MGARCPGPCGGLTLIPGQLCGDCRAESGLAAPMPALVVVEVRPGRPLKPITAEMVTAIVAAYDGGESIDRIGVDHGVSGRRIRKALIGAGVEIRRPGRRVVA